MHPGTSRPEDRSVTWQGDWTGPYGLGDALEIGDVDLDGHADLAISAPAAESMVENRWTGRVFVLLGPWSP